VLISISGAYEFFSSQCIQGLPKGALRKIQLTGSGGAFRYDKGIKMGKFLFRLSAVKVSRIQAVRDQWIGRFRFQGKIQYTVLEI
jgi:hypothetical protein